MFENIFTVGNYVLILFILIGVGFFSNKAKILDGSALKGLTNLVLYIATPCAIVNSYQREFDKNMLHGLLLTVIAAVLSFVVNILLSHLLIKDKDKKREKTLRFGAVFSNSIYMSLPLQEAMLGKIGVFYGATYVAVFQIVLWTYGVVLMSGDIKNISLRKVIVNPGVTSTLLGILLYVFSVSIPATIYEPMKYLASLNTPLPMIIVGYYLAETSFNIRGLSAYVSVIFRLVISPITTLAILFILGISGDIAIACVIATSAPVAAVATMFSEKFGGDTILSATFVSVTTILSIITMPLIVAISAMI